MVAAKSFSRRALLRYVIRIAVAVLATSTAARAQVVRGTVVDEASGRAMPGVVVVLLDSTGKRLTGVLADDNGQYAIRVGAAGTYGVRADRIGFRAAAATTVVLKAGETIQLKLVTRPIPVSLAAVRVTAKTQCVARASDGREVSAVWEEARKALYATDLSQRQELFSARMMRYERTLDATTLKVIGYQSKEGNATTSSPFVSMPAAQLSSDGFVRQGRSETIFYGPDAGVLLSDEFLGDHCFNLRAGDGKRSGLIGLEFEPVRGRDKPEIGGTLWIDRKSAELRDLEYSYRALRNMPTTVRSEDFGGNVQFTRMPTGAWIVSKWVIRMPMLVDKGPLAATAGAGLPGVSSQRGERVRLSAIREEGGQVLETFARGTRGASATDVSSVRGTVFDSTRMTALGDARVFLDGTQFSVRSGADGSFVLENVPSGTYSLSVLHPRFDSLGVTPPAQTVELLPGQPATARLAGPSVATVLTQQCAVEERGPGMASLRGRIRDAASGEPAADVDIRVSWNRIEGVHSSPTVMQRSATTRTDGTGRYDLCGLPDRVRLTIQITAGEKRSLPVTTVLDQGELSILDFAVGVPSTTTAVTAIASGPTVRSPMAAARNSAMQDFDRRRRRGGGSFLTRAQIDSKNATRLTDLLRSLPGVSVQPNENGAMVVELRGSRRIAIEQAPPPARTDTGRAQPPPSQNATPSGQMTLTRCSAAFQVDGMPLDGVASIDAELQPGLIEGIEVYSGGQVPIEFSGRNSQCGLVIIWTRGFAEKRDFESRRDGGR